MPYIKAGELEQRLAKARRNGKRAGFKQARKYNLKNYVLTAVGSTLLGAGTIGAGVAHNQVKFYDAIKAEVEDRTEGFPEGLLYSAGKATFAFQPSENKEQIALAYVVRRDVLSGAYETADWTLKSGLTAAGAGSMLLALQLGSLYIRREKKKQKGSSSASTAGRAMTNGAISLALSPIFFYGAQGTYEAVDRWGNLDQAVRQKAETMGLDIAQSYWKDVTDNSEYFLGSAGATLVLSGVSLASKRRRKK